SFVARVQHHVVMLVCEKLRGPEAEPVGGAGDQYPRHWVPFVMGLQLASAAIGRQRRYPSITGATIETISSLLARTTASSFTTWRSMAMPISCATTSDARSWPSG